VQRLLILSQGEEVTEADVAAALGAQKTTVSMEAIPAALFDLPLREARDHFERPIWNTTSNSPGGKCRRHRRDGSMERTHLYRKLKGLGIDIKGTKESEHGRGRQPRSTAR